MFEGAIYFKKTKHGYVVDDFIEFMSNHTPFIMHWPFTRFIRVEGSFRFNPVRGQFCKRPHKLIKWK